MRLLDYAAADFAADFASLRQERTQATGTIENTVIDIINRVKSAGDTALIEYEHKFDGATLTPEELLVSQAEMDEAIAGVSASGKEALQQAARRIRAFHEEQKAQLEKTWYKEDEPGIRLGQLVRPLESVGLYVPGGKAVYPSSVLMNAIPALIAKVKNIAICSPPDRSGTINPYVLAAARIAGVTRVYKLGGAQAIAAMAYGTKSIPRVDKIVGPGNIYVATAKRLVSDSVGIDMFAGPSEVLIIADESANPVWVAADILAQAEHDAQAQPILVTTSRKLAEGVILKLDRQCDTLWNEGHPARIQAKQSLEKNGAIIIVPDTEQAIELANQVAPEHLQLMVDEPDAWLDGINHAGAIFLGHYSPTALGDYIAGPNHVLPTSGCARFSSPLGVYDFIKRSSVIHYSRQALMQHGKLAVELARMEGLSAHAAAVRVRLKED